MDALIISLFVSLLAGPILTRLLRRMGLLASEADEQYRVRLRGEAEVLLRRIRQSTKTIREQDPYGVTDRTARQGWLQLGPRGSLIGDAVSFILKAEEDESHVARLEAEGIRQELKKRLELSDDCLADHAAFILQQRAACRAEVIKQFADFATKEERSGERPPIAEHQN